MPIPVLCMCGKLYQIEEKYQGRAFKCQNCQAQVIVPDIDSLLKTPQTPEKPANKPIQPAKIMVLCKCGKRYFIDDEHKGKTFRCQACQAELAAEVSSHTAYDEDVTVDEWSHLPHTHFSVEIEKPKGWGILRSGLERRYDIYNNEKKLIVRGVENRDALPFEAKPLLLSFGCCFSALGALLAAIPTFAPIVGKPFATASSWAGFVVMLLCLVLAVATGMYLRRIIVSSTRLSLESVTSRQRVLVIVQDSGWSKVLDSTARHIASVKRGMGIYTHTIVKYPDGKVCAIVPSRFASVIVETVVFVVIVGVIAAIGHKVNPTYFKTPVSATMSTPFVISFVLLRHVAKAMWGGIPASVHLLTDPQAIVGTFSTKVFPRKIRYAFEPNLECKDNFDPLILLALAVMPNLFWTGK